MIAINSKYFRIRSKLKINENLQEVNISQGSATNSLSAVIILACSFLGAVEFPV